MNKFKHLMNKCTRIGASIPIESSKVVIEVVRTETIKPLTPTPDHLKKFGMSITDHLFPNHYMPIVFFYSATGEMSVADRVRRLKESLSKTLVRFYPVAGRVDREGVYVDCDDSGVEFVETKVKGCSLADILKSPQNEVLIKLLPCDRTTLGPDPLMRVRSNVLECGALAVGTCFSHKIVDGFGRSAFLKEWTATARGDADPTSPPPDLDAIASRFPAFPNKRFLHARIPSVGALRRFVFDSDKITSLRDKVASASGVRPTRMKALTAFLYKCMVNSLTVQLGHETRPSLACQLVNLRTRLDPPLSETSLGNMASMVFAESGDRNEFVNDEMSIITQFKRGMRELTRDWETRLKDLMEALKKNGEMPKFIKKDHVDTYIFSSTCGFDLYGSNFGWGKPVWISIADSHNSNMAIMIDAKDGGGIEAWITLREEHMAFFETNTDLLEFASLNPPINLS